MRPFAPWRRAGPTDRLTGHAAFQQWAWTASASGNLRFIFQVAHIKVNARRPRTPREPLGSEVTRLGEGDAFDFTSISRNSAATVAYSGRTIALPTGQDATA